MSGFVKWASLNQFHEVVKNLNYPRIYSALKEHNFKIKFGLKNKIHGTNACVRIEPDGKVIGQKRTSDVRVGADNAGFAAWVAANESYFASLANSRFTLYIYGEWAGPGIQDNVACSMTRNKIFYPFAVELHRDGNPFLREYDPNLIEVRLSKRIPDDIIVLPWYDTIELDFENKEKLDTTVLSLNKAVEQIGECDPFFNDTFGIEGHGEGVVAFPILGKLEGIYAADEFDYFSWFNFKAKSEAHRVNKTKHSVQIDPEKFANSNRFADAFCTEQRLEQGFSEAIQGRKDMKLIPDLMKWVMSDIWKESATEREASGLDWKALSKTCTTRIALWYKARIMEV